ncbi:MULTISPECIES: lipopolysaccharide biosynthesis protein [Prochlorococcus]|uniref:Membrane protein involved in the export of O-antigen n=1 Tax=Prochlorococcus marinus str. MIT 9116 TaxID=167544 RepID=A0A0A1ZU11_PROMR|nr:oligosaccharide flippase family protein [Prochlorococcus marinus]KGF91955.1 Membrane protein involved in the export of O-antigen [Prochlorococcus marinus str. MIT 9107]KGF93042.1 Membrane protein involved in the export of O-antigen [Prochlorococcus marinus str. MIT 9116]KGF94000.1 Membrane protein involved in the export of O-antigen [Prochlorococcus marinus str. MIT 9123]
MRSLKNEYEKYKELTLSLLSHKNLTVNTISLFIIYGFNFLISLLVLPHLIKSYGISKWGEVVFLQLVLNYLIWIIDWSFNQYSSKFISINSNKFKELKNVFRETWTAQFILTILSIFISFFLLYFLGEETLFLPFFLILIGNFLQPYWFLNGLEKIYESALLQLFHKVFFAYLTISFINNSSEVKTYFLYYSLSFFITGIFYQIRVSSKYKNLIGLISFWKGFRTIKKSSGLFISSILGSLINSSLPLLISSFLGTGKLGMFNIADRIKGISVQLSHPLSHSLYPRMTKEYYKSKNKGNKILKYFLYLFLSITIVSFIFLNLYIKEVVSYFTNEDILKIISILRILLFSFVINVIEEIMVYQYMIPNGMYKEINKLRISILTTIILTGVPFIYFFGIIGAAYSNLISELVGLIYVLTKYNRTKKQPYKKESF